MNNNPLEKVLEEDMCIWCWVCSSFKNTPYSINLNSFWQYKAYFKDNSSLNKSALQGISEVCPFSNDSMNEDQISEKVFSDIKNKKQYVWKYLNFYAWHVSQENFRGNWSSWWMWTWVLSELLRKWLIDKVIHVKESNKGEVFYEYAISNNLEELNQWSKSKYYPIKLDEVIWLLKNDESNSKYAVVWIPCFLKSLRLLSFKDEVINKKLKFFIWLVCGHLKGTKFAEYLAYQTSWLKKDKIESINFREKLSNWKANSYWFKVVDKNKKTYVKETKNLLGWNWWMNYFKYNACDYCDDIYAEVADLTIWDAWIKAYTKDDKWNNICISRNKTIDGILQEWIQNNNLALDLISYEQILESQYWGIRHKINGTKYRLFKNNLHLKKRVKASNDIAMNYKLIFRLREILCKKSNELYAIAEKKDNLSGYRLRMAGYNFLYYIMIIINKLIIKIKK